MFHWIKIEFPFLKTPRRLKKNFFLLPELPLQCATVCVVLYPPISSDNPCWPSGTCPCRETHLGSGPVHCVGSEAAVCEQRASTQWEHCVGRTRPHTQKCSPPSLSLLHPTPHPLPPSHLQLTYNELSAPMADRVFSGCRCTELGTLKKGIREGSSTPKWQDERFTWGWSYVDRHWLWPNTALNMLCISGHWWLCSAAAPVTSWFWMLLIAVRSNLKKGREHLYCFCTRSLSGWWLSTTPIKGVGTSALVYPTVLWCFRKGLPRS